MKPVAYLGWAWIGLSIVCWAIVACAVIGAIEVVRFVWHWVLPCLSGFHP